MSAKTKIENCHLARIIDAPAHAGVTADEIRALAQEVLEWRANFTAATVEDLQQKSGTTVLERHWEGEARRGYADIEQLKSWLTEIGSMHLFKFIAALDRDGDLKLEKVTEAVALGVQQLTQQRDHAYKERQDTQDLLTASRKVTTDLCEAVQRLGAVNEKTLAILNETRRALDPDGKLEPLGTIDVARGIREECDTLKERNVRLAAAVESNDKGWKETALQHLRNETYYRNLVIQIGVNFGIEAYTCDDGSHSQDILCAKVPELVRDRLNKLEDLAEAQKELAANNQDYLNACRTIAKMHAAAVDEITGPRRGVVEDIEDLKSHYDFNRVTLARLQAILKWLNDDWNLNRLMNWSLEEANKRPSEEFYYDLISTVDEVLSNPEGDLARQIRKQSDR